uniref:Uncharacterized protein n=1 Tax=Lepeophtheirus salmonis TaxID=72036 RepID=A0A0K2U032_LEPSM
MSLRADDHQDHNRNRILCFHAWLELIKVQTDPSIVSKVMVGINGLKIFSLKKKRSYVCSFLINKNLAFSPSATLFCFDS